MRCLSAAVYFWKCTLLNKILKRQICTRQPIKKARCGFVPSRHNNSATQSTVRQSCLLFSINGGRLRALRNSAASPPAPSPRCSVLCATSALPSPMAITRPLPLFHSFIPSAVLHPSVACCHRETCSANALYADLGQFLRSVYPSYELLEHISGGAAMSNGNEQ